MLQLQYLNTKLKKNHIEQILSIYNIKYTTMKKEIDNKIDIMIKTFNQDISSFLNNMDDITEQKKKLKSLEYNKIELESVREQLKDKIHELTKLKRELELLKSENITLKNLKNINSNNNNNNNNNNKSPKKKRIFSPSFRDNQYKSSTNVLINKTNTQKKIKKTKAFFLKTERKELKEDKDNNKELKLKRFKSPQNFDLPKNRNKRNDMTLDNKNKNSKINIKKENSNSFSNSSKNLIKTETNVLKKSKFAMTKTKTTKDVIKKNILNKNVDLRKSYRPNNKNKPITNKNLETSTKLLSKTTVNSKNKIKVRESKTLPNYENGKNENSPKKNDDKYYEKDSFSNSESDSSSSSSSDNSSIETEVNNYIDDEINEINDLEEEILSIMDQIKDFQKQKHDLT